MGILFLELFSAAQDPTGPVRSHWLSTGWDIKVSSLIQDQSVAHTEELLQLLLGHELQNEGVRDGSMWEWDPKSVFFS